MTSLFSKRHSSTRMLAIVSLFISMFLVGCVVSSSSGVNSAAEADGKSKSSGKANAKANASANANASAKADSKAKGKTKVVFRSKSRVTKLKRAKKADNFKARALVRGGKKVSIKKNIKVNTSGKASGKASGSVKFKAKGGATSKSDKDDNKASKSDKDKDGKASKSDKDKDGKASKTDKKKDDSSATSKKDKKDKKNKKKKDKKNKKDDSEEEETDGTDEGTEETDESEEPEIIDPPDTPPDNDFGYEDPVRGCFEGIVYQLPNGTPKLPTAWDDLEGLSVVYACEWDIPTRAWETGFPGVEELFEWFAVRYTGAFSVEEAGEWKFKISSDDGAKLYIDGELVIDNDGTHAPKTKEATVQLEAGDHDMVLEYFQGPRYHINLQVYATPPGGEEGIFSVR